MSNLGPLHKRMMGLCGYKSAGIGVNRDWLLGLMKEQINIINNSQPLQTPIDVLSVKLSVISVNLKQAASSDQLDAELRLDIQPTAEPGKSFRSWNLSAKGVTVEIGEDSYHPGELCFLATNIPLPKQQPSSPEPDPSLVAKYYPKNPDDYKQDERAIILLGWKSLITQFVQMIPFPKIIQSQVTVKVLPPFQITYDPDYVIISSPNVTLTPPGCPPTIGSHYNIETKFQSVQAKSLEGRTSFACQSNLTRSKSAMAKCNSEVGIVQIFLYLPRHLTLLKYVSDTLSPAVAANDSGVFAFIRWYYNLSASLKQASLALDFTPPRIMQGSATFHAAGSAGANVKIGCIEYSLVGVNIETNPDYKVDASLSLCIENHILYLDADLKWSGGDIHFSGLGFPLDAVVNAILGSIGNRFVRDLLSKSLSGFKIQLLNLDELFAGRSGGSSEALVEKESSIFGLVLGN